ncbi:MAG: hypothetical protein FWC56_01140 [Phycisphaerae bacterium]|nr:hypothetical protein [Phycisphaerae bacterium]
MSKHAIYKAKEVIKLDGKALKAYKRWLEHKSIANNTRYQNAQHELNRYSYWSCAEIARALVEMAAAQKKKGAK